MAKLRKANSYRRIERANTRKSKYRSKSFVKASPHNLIVKYNMGNLSKKFEYSLFLKTKESIQIRHNALEAARKTSNRKLEAALGKDNFYLVLRLYPHHILRENPLAAGAGADRMSTGMSHSFGKVIGIAAQAKKGSTIFQIGVDEKGIPVAKDAMRSIRCKMPCACAVEIVKNKVSA